MSAAYINAELRRQVASRAGSVCEYCLIHEDDTFFGCHVDHIISEKHGGLTTADDLLDLSAARRYNFCHDPAS